MARTDPKKIKNDDLYDGCRARAFKRTAGRARQCTFLCGCRPGERRRGPRTALGTCRDDCEDRQGGLRPGGRKPGGGRRLGVENFVPKAATRAYPGEKTGHFGRGRSGDIPFALGRGHLTEGQVRCPRFSAFSVRVKQHESRSAVCWRAFLNARRPPAWPRAWRKA